MLSWDRKLIAARSLASNGSHFELLIIVAIG